MMKDLVSYLNTLHRVNGNNINTTAEANSHNEFAAKILERETSLVDYIVSKMEHGGKVLLTGFAGDGKTTLASLVVEKLTGKMNELLEPVVNISIGNQKYTIIKDLSEIPEKAAERTLYEALSSQADNVLIVSNTGSIRTKLLGIWEDHRDWGGFSTKSVFETAILSGIECEDQKYIGEIIIGGIKLLTINLVKRDNLETAKKVFIKILNLEDWNTNDSQEKASTISLNVKMLKANNYLAVDRMFLIYRRLYEYGARLTIRYLLEHLAYTITGNRDSFDKQDLNYFFPNNFFGAVDDNASEIEAIKILKKIPFGINITSAWKRRIWCGSMPELYKIQIPFELSEIMRFKPLFSPECYINRFFCHKDQVAILRMIFFMNNVENSDNEFSKYITSFLVSPAIIQFCQLQDNDGMINRQLAQNLNAVLKSVLRDYCAGIKYQEGAFASRNDIYLTMARKAKSINQSTQVVLGKFCWDRGSVQLASDLDSRGLYQFQMEISGKIGKTRINLDLPLLDFIYQISAGCLLESIESTFKKRLDNIKLELLKQSTLVSDDEIVLIYKDINNEVHELYCNIDDKQLSMNEG